MIVTLNKSTKIKGKGLVLAGVEIDVTKEQKAKLEKDGFLGEFKKSGMPSNEKEIKELVAKVANLEKQLKDGSDNTALTTEIETLKGAAETDEETITALTTEIETLKGELAGAIESNVNLDEVISGLKTDSKTKDDEIKTLKASLAKATKK